jgi:hypothetical protein
MANPLSAFRFRRLLRDFLRDRLGQFHPLGFWHSQLVKVGHYKFNRGEGRERLSEYQDMGYALTVGVSFAPGG